MGRDGKPLTRLPGEAFLAPCRTEKGCPKGTPEEPKTLWPENELFYEFYKQCKAVGQWPDDPIVRRNAAVIADLEQAIDREREAEFQAMLIHAIGTAGITSVTDIVGSA